MIVLSPRKRGIVAVLVAAAALGGCSTAAPRINSQLQPSQPIIVYPNSYDRVYTTAFLSSPSAYQAGVNGRSLTISLFNGAHAVADQLTIDYDGNLGIRGSIRARGSISTVSHRSAKKDIHPFATDALSLLDRTSVVTYLYKGESESSDRHIGFIAEDTPAELSGSAHDRYDVTNTVAVNIAATKELERHVSRLEDEVAQLESELAARDREARRQGTR